MNNDYTIKDRLYKALDISVPNLHFFLKIASIKLDEKIPTACISCSDEPILRLNPKFVNEHCKTNEHLLMLVLHELYHFILGHTTFKIRPDEASNIVFDAVINSLLCKKYSEEKYTSFFSNLNSDKSPIGCLLRPIGKNTPKEASLILNKLYYKDSCTYKEIYDYLLNNDKIKKNYILIGSHGEYGSIAPENKKLVDAILNEMEQDDLMKEAGHSEVLKEHKIEMEDPNLKEYRRLSKYLVDSTLENANTMMFKCREQNYTKYCFMPNSSDRTSYAKGEFYNNIIYKSLSHNRRLGLIEGGKARVYLDVSGSVYQDIEKMLPLIYKLMVNNLIDTYVFSDEVFQLTKKNVKECKIPTTGGTDVNAIFKHYYNDKNNHNVKVIIVTDGYFDTLNDKYKELIKKHKTKVEIVLFGRFVNTNSIKKVTSVVKRFRFNY